MLYFIDWLHVQNIKAIHGEMNELRDDIQDHVLPATPCATMNENKSHKRWSSQAMYVIICAHFHAPTKDKYENCVSFPMVYRL